MKPDKNSNKKYNLCKIDKETFVQMQQNEETLRQAKGKNVYVVENLILYRVKENNHDGAPSKQLIIPSALRKEVMEVAHDSKMSGDFGIKRTQERINACFYWPGMITDIRWYCKSCGICQRTASKGRESHVPLGKMPLIDVPFKRIDLIGPLTPTSSEGHKYILTMVDYAS